MKLTAGILVLYQLTMEGVSGLLFITRLGWWHGTVVERRSLTGELSLSCA